MHILLALPGFHRVRRGAEVAFESIAQEIALAGKHKITLVGSGEQRDDRVYDFRRVAAVSRDHFEHWPKLPFLRNQYMYEELTFAAAMAFNQGCDAAEITVTCSYPYTNWVLRNLYSGKRRLPHVFVTQNGDWPATGRKWEPMFFFCDGLVCTNPTYFERNRQRWFSTLIPNGVDPKKFYTGFGSRQKFGIPEDCPVVLMVSALESSKGILEAIGAVSAVKDVFLVVAGDGSLRRQVDQLAAELLPGKFLRGTFAHEEMPELYRCADIFLHMARGESFGNVYVESLASGLPIVANDEAGTRWILGDYARLVDTRSHEAVSRAINNALRWPPRNRMEMAAWAYGRYSWSVVADRYIEFFEQVLRKHRRMS